MDLTLKEVYKYRTEEMVVKTGVFGLFLSLLARLQEHPPIAALFFF
jgi:hypothetical protein